MSTNNSNLLLILERSNANLTIAKDSGEYILEGIFAQFGVENNNKRIYEEKEYLPHLEYLKKKISENRLMGELDHPDKFEVSLNKVSHIIESLEYDSASRQIKGKVRLLDTPAGKIAKNLVDSGVPVSISSRAAGSVTEDKKVSIKRIFTYDLVADPGFEDAQLERVNESFGLNNDSDIQIYDASNWKFQFESGILEAEKETTTEEKIKKETPTVMEGNFVTVESMNKYSVIIKEEMEKINSRLNELGNVNESASNTELEELKEKVNKIVEFTNILSEEINNNRGFANYLSETLNTGLEYTEGEVGTKLDQIIEYVNQEVQPHVSKLINHNNHIVEKLNHTIGYVEDEVATKLDESLQHNDYLAEEIQKNRAYSTYLAENAIDREDFTNLVEYTEHVYESMSSGSAPKAPRAKDNISETEDTKKPNVSESINTDGKSRAEMVRERSSATTDKIDALIESINKNKIEQNSTEKRYPFLNIISEENRAVFANLDETKKEKVREELLKTNSFDKKVLNESFVSVLEVQAEADKTPKWITSAPENYRKVYESLDETQKNRIHAQATWYDGKLNTEYQIKNFWETRGFNESKLIKEKEDTLNESVVTIKENEGAPVKDTRNSLGYSNDHVNAIKESLNRFL